MAKRNKKHSFWRRLLVITSLSVLVVVIGLGVVLGLIWHSENLDHTKLTPQSQNAIFYDQNNQIITTPTTKKYASLNEINPACVQAFIAVEDRHFYEHHGLSYPRIVKALVNNLAAGYSKEGASTITQQLVKNTHLTNEKTLQRKIREAVLALKLEQSYDKDTILELYLNAIYFGNNLYGIANAAEFYFDKTPAELTPAEGAGLAGLIKNPSKYDPVGNHDNFVTRAHLVLQLMQEQGYLTADEYTDALADPLTITTPKDLWIGTTYQTMALKEASQILNLSESDIINYGYQIETYYNPEQQKLIYDAMNEPTYALAGDKFALLSAPNGQVGALWTSNPTLLTARRNFGSAMKPLLVYAPALELGVIQPETAVDDSPLIDTNFTPHNFDQQYHGIVTARTALMHSYNVPAVKILNATTIPAATDIANKLGMNLTDHESLAMALGNTNQGTTFLELAGGYQTLANQGRYSPTRFVRLIRDRNGNTVYFDLTNKYNYAPQGVAEDTAYLLTDMLVDTTRAGTGRKLSYLNTAIASKTGTTERSGSKNNTDSTLVSYTPEHVLLTWHGNASMRPENDLPRGATGGGKLANAAKQIHSVISDPSVNFVQPSSVKTVRLDAADYAEHTLRLANAATPEHETVSALFANRYLPDTVSERYLIPTTTVINGRLGENNLPQVNFATLPYQTYSIYRNNVLQAVIDHQTGEYTYVDKNPEPTNLYRVDAALPDQTPVSSNEITLRLPTTTQYKAVERKRVPWYF